MGSNPEWLIAADQYLYFSADDGPRGVELWRSDGTASGTRIVADIGSGPIWSSPIRRMRPGRLRP